MTKRRVLIFALLVSSLFVFVVLFTQPGVVYRLSTKAFSAYEHYLLHYPGSTLIAKETKATSKVTMATDYIFYSSDSVDTVLNFMEQHQPGYAQLQGSYLIGEPTFRNTTCANETMFQGLFQILARTAPCIEVFIYPATSGGTAIRFSENWSSQGFPAWLKNGRFYFSVILVFNELPPNKACIGLAGTRRIHKHFSGFGRIQISSVI